MEKRYRNKIIIIIIIIIVMMMMMMMMIMIIIILECKEREAEEDCRNLTHNILYHIIPHQLCRFEL